MQQKMKFAAGRLVAFSRRFSLGHVSFACLALACVSFAGCSSNDVTAAAGAPKPANGEAKKGAAGDSPNASDSPNIDAANDLDSKADPKKIVPPASGKGDKPPPKGNSQLQPIDDDTPVRTVAADAPAIPYKHAEVPDLRTRKDGSDWPSFLGPNRDSKSSETGILTKWPKEGPPLKWTMRLGTGYCMPAVSKGRLFMFHRVGPKARLDCVKSETGEPLWRFEYNYDYRDLLSYDDGPRAQPVVDDDRVYIFGPTGVLHCLRVTDGAKFWEIDTNEKFGVVQNFFGVGSTPLVENDLLIVQVGGSPPGEAENVYAAQGNVKNNGTAVVAFDKLTGEIKYKSGDELASYASPVCATIEGKRRCFLFARGGLLAFDPKDGKQVFYYPWRAKILESVNAATPIIFNDQVFISETYGRGCSLLNVKGEGYDVVWSDPERVRDRIMETHWNTPIYLDGYIYGSSGRHTENAELRCVDAKTGKVKWSQENLSRSSLLYADGHFICLTEYGALLLLKATPEKFDMVSGVVLQDAKRAPEPDDPPKADGGRIPVMLKYPAWAAPILSQGILYARGKDRLVALELIPAK